MSCILYFSYTYYPHLYAKRCTLHAKFIYSRLNEKAILTNNLVTYQVIEILPEIFSNITYPAEELF